MQSHPVDWYDIMSKYISCFKYHFSFPNLCDVTDLSLSYSCWNKPHKEFSLQFKYSNAGFELASQQVKICHASDTEIFFSLILFPLTITLNPTSKFLN